MDRKEKDELFNDDDVVIESFDSIKKRLEKKGKQAGVLEQDEIIEAFSQLDVTDDDIDGLITYFKDKKINVLTDDSGDLDSLVDIEVDENSDGSNLLLDDDLFDEVSENELAEIEKITSEGFDSFAVGDVKVNDSVKM